MAKLDRITEEVRGTTWEEVVMKRIELENKMKAEGYSFESEQIADTTKDECGLTIKFCKDK